MVNLAVIGTQWGDEGKGKVIDFLVSRGNFGCVVRYQGGDNAGHTIIYNGHEVKLHSIPSGILSPDIYNLVSSGVVINPFSPIEEMAQLRDIGVDVTPENFGISSGAHVIFDYHKEREAFIEEKRGKRKIDTTKKGIGPAYTDKHSRHGIRFAEFLNPDAFEKILQQNLETLVQMNGTNIDVGRYLDLYRDAQEKLRPYEVNEVELIMNGLKDENKLVESAQGILLDNGCGTYPFVTSSEPVLIPPIFGVEERIGIMKMYITRVGAGPFPTKMEEGVEKHVRNKGKEFGATTGRPRGCGWLDLVLGRYAVQVGV